MFIVVYKEVYTKALLIFYLCFSLVRGFFIVMSIVNLLTPLLIIYRFLDKKNPLGKALITNTDKSIFWICE
jgi:hypothetical protein